MILFSLEMTFSSLNPIIWRIYGQYVLGVFLQPQDDHPTTKKWLGLEIVAKRAINCRFFLLRTQFFIMFLHPFCTQNVFFFVPETIIAQKAGSSAIIYLNTKCHVLIQFGSNLSLTFYSSVKNIAPVFAFSVFEINQKQTLRIFFHEWKFKQLF